MAALECPLSAGAVLRLIVIVLALGAALVLPVASQARDSRLIALSAAHLKTTKAIPKCDSMSACTFVIARNIDAMTAVTRRATVLFRTAPSRPNANACLDAGTLYLAAARKVIAAARNFVSRGTTGSRDAYVGVAFRLDVAMFTLEKAC